MASVQDDQAGRLDPVRKMLVGAVLALGLLGSIPAVAVADEAQGQSNVPGAGHPGLIAAAHPLAVEAGLDVLRAGGTAMDAAVAVQAVLGLVEPQSSGLGGGAFMLHWDAANLRLDSYDGRETAPMAADETLFLDRLGRPMPFMEAVIGGRSVGVPGTVRLLERAHGNHGQLDWAQLFDAAITLAEDGFPVSPRLHSSIANATGLDSTGATRRYFFEADGTPLRIGRLRDNPAYAALLRGIAANGGDHFYDGVVAADIVATVQGYSANPGRMSRADLARYTARRRAPVCAPYRFYRVCGMGPPSSGGVTVAQILGLLEYFNMPAIGDGADGHHLFAEAARLAFADRGLYLADDEFVPVPVQGMLSPRYLQHRAQLIDFERTDGGAVSPGAWPGQTMDQTRMRHGSLSADPSQKNHGTTHFVIADRHGNIVSYTGSIEMAFGSRLMVHGILLNNQLTDFSFAPVRDGRPVANRVEPGKRPRSSMAPTIVFDPAARPVLATGSPGGSRIINYTAQSILRVLDWAYTPEQAVSAPHVSNRNGVTDVEEAAGPEADALANDLAARGHDIRRTPMVSGLHMILFTPSGPYGAADPRREGVAAFAD